MSKSKNVYTGDPDFDELLDKAMRIMKTKSVDYAEDGDRLAEIRATAEANEITMRQCLGVYMNKHLRSIRKWITGRELKGEPVEDKFLDNLVYSLIGYKLAKEERRTAESAKLPVSGGNIQDNLNVVISDYTDFVKKSSETYTSEGDSCRLGSEPPSRYCPYTFATNEECDCEMHVAERKMIADRS